ncbi:NRT1/ PTR family 5.2-like protein, partial [Tanacetum coccineum]
MLNIFFGTLFANTVLVYIQDNARLSLDYGLPTLELLISIMIFLAGTPFYRHRVPTGSPFTKMAGVILAALNMWKIVIDYNAWSSGQACSLAPSRLDLDPTKVYLFASPHAAASSPVVDFFAAPEQVVAPKMKPAESNVQSFDPEVMVIQNKSHSDEEIFCRIRSLVQKPDALQSGDSATDVARIIGIAPAMTKEHLLSVESK